MCAYVRVRARARVYAGLRLGPKSMSKVSDAKNEKTNRKSFARAFLTRAKSWRRERSALAIFRRDHAEIITILPRERVSKKQSEGGIKFSEVRIRRLLVQLSLLLSSAAAHAKNIYLFIYYLSDLWSFVIYDFNAANVSLCIMKQHAVGAS